MPWEASGPLLQGLRRQLSQGARPTVRWARWYWRIYLAAPATPPRVLDKLARDIAAREAIGQLDDEYLRGLEARLAFRRYEGGDDAEFEAALESGFIPAFEPEISVLDTPGMVALMAEGLPGRTHEGALQQLADIFSHRLPDVEREEQDGGEA